jgi:quercetin dioxygenase-like cupin family protein
MVVVRAGSALSEEEIVNKLRSAYLSPTAWGNAPGYRYGSHSHTYEKILYCVSGSITFHTEEGDVLLSPGDRLELQKGVNHSATVGPQGVRCVEAAG